jgi:hypothetical protein
VAECGRRASSIRSVCVLVAGLLTVIVGSPAISSGSVSAHTGRESSASRTAGRSRRPEQQNYKPISAAIDTTTDDGVPDRLTIDCPIPSKSEFIDSWGGPRSGGRRHQGVDMIAPAGTPIAAASAGFAEFKVNNSGGNAIWLTTVDGDKFHYAHLDSWEGSSRDVSAGKVIGYVGSSGNARGNHLHFEVHPDANPTNPFPVATAACGGEVASVSDAAPTSVLSRRRQPSAKVGRAPTTTTVCRSMGAWNVQASPRADRRSVPAQVPSRSRSSDSQHVPRRRRRLAAQRSLPSQHPSSQFQWLPHRQHWPTPQSL